MINIALAGNPNCGKTTVFNMLTGAEEYVGNRAGVTVEKKEKFLKGRKDVVVTDLPGIYSLSPYTAEEVITREHLLSGRPQVILNVADATKLQRSLYLTLQLMDMGLPLVLGLNMADAAEKQGVVIDTERLGRILGVPVVKMSAVKGIGLDKAVEKAVNAAGKKVAPPKAFSTGTERAILNIENMLKGQAEKTRWYAAALFQRDERVYEDLSLNQDTKNQIEAVIRKRERECDDSADSIIISERYDIAEKAAEQCVLKTKKESSLSEKIDRIVTGKFTALPVFAVVMTAVYFLSAGPVGSMLSGFFEDTVINGWITQPLRELLIYVDCADWLVGLVIDGIMGGVGTVVGFLPQLALLFVMLSLLEECGYMARVAFIMDRFFRAFGLSGKSFIPMLIAMGCGVPAVMSSRTVDNESQRRMTIITATFMPCGAKLPVISMIAGTFFGGAWWVAVLAYFTGAAAVLISGLILKGLKIFRDNDAPFVMELPDYHLPKANIVFRTVKERCVSFVKRAGTVILPASCVVWILLNVGWSAGGFTFVSEPADSVLKNLGELLVAGFQPLGFGSWQAAVASVLGLLAKEELVGVFGVLGDAGEIFRDSLSAFSFMMFNLLCMPCVAAMSAIRKEMDNVWWTGFALLYQTVFAYGTALCIYQTGTFVRTGNITVGTVTAMLTFAAAVILILYSCKKSKKEKTLLTKERKRV